MLTSLIVKFVPKTAIRRVILNSAFALSGVNHAANFFIYIVLSPRFRQLLVERLDRGVRAVCRPSLPAARRMTGSAAARRRRPSAEPVSAAAGAAPAGVPLWAGARRTRHVGVAARLAGRRSVVVRAVGSADSLDLRSGG